MYIRRVGATPQLSLAMFVKFTASDYYICFDIKDTGIIKEGWSDIDFNIKRDNEIVTQPTDRHCTITSIHLYSGNGEEREYKPSTIVEVFTHHDIVTILLSQKTPPRYIITNNMLTSNILRHLILTYSNREMWKCGQQDEKIIIWTFMQMSNRHVLQLFRQIIAHNAQNERSFVLPRDITCRRRHVYLSAAGNRAITREEMMFENIWEEHLARLRKVLGKIQGAGLPANLVGEEVPFFVNVYSIIRELWRYGIQK